jgi:hypothetical protein
MPAQTPFTPVIISTPYTHGEVGGFEIYNDWMLNVSRSDSKYPLLYHIHWSSPTTPTYTIYCYKTGYCRSCGEAPPSGVLFRARTVRLEGLMDAS